LSIGYAGREGYARCLVPELAGIPVSAGHQIGAGGESVLQRQ